MKERLRVATLTVACLISACSAAAPEDCTKIGGLAGEVSRSVLEHPGDWSSDGYYFRHKGGVSFWVASGAGYTRPVQSTDSDEWPPGLSIIPTASQACVYSTYTTWREGRQYEPSLGVTHTEQQP